MSVPEFLYTHTIRSDKGTEHYVTERYRVVKVTAKRVFVARKPEGQWSEADGTFSFSREAVEAGEVVSARGYACLTPNPDPESYWRAMSQAVLVDGKNNGIVA
jgi:hypothetical protein